MPDVRSFTYRSFWVYLQFYDAYNGKEITRLCGNKETSVIAPSNSVLVVFRTDGYLNYRGWNLQWPTGKQLWGVIFVYYIKVFGCKPFFDNKTCQEPFEFSDVKKF